MTGRIIFEIAVGVLAVYGLCEGLIRLRAHAFLPRRLETRTLILLRGSRRDLPELTSPTARRLWADRGMGEVILVDAGLDRAGRRQADRLARLPGNAAVIDPACLKEALKL